MSRQVRMSEAWRPGKVNMHRAGKRLAAAPAERLPGLYDPANERDSCGVGFIVNLAEREVAPASSRTACASSRTSSIAAPSAPTR